ncbi:MAG TPA: helix-turn-helix domain-containing protein, partial [Albitalea sp.]
SKTPKALALRARIVLSCALGRSNDEVARLFDVAPKTVGKWRARFLEKRLAGLVDEPRSGAPHKLDEAEVARLVTTALTAAAPADHARWSGRALGQRFGVSQSTVSRVLRALGLQLPAAAAFRQVIDPAFIDMVVVGLYVDAAIRAVVLCGRDGAGNARASAMADLALPWMPLGTVLPVLFEATCRGAREMTLFEALRLATCEPRCHGGRGAGLRALPAFLRRLDAALPAGRALHVFLDQRAPAVWPALERLVADGERFRLHVAPSCAAWLAEVGRWIALRAERQDLAARSPEGAAPAHERGRSSEPTSRQAGGVPFVWIRTPEKPALPMAAPRDAEGISDSQAVLHADASRRILIQQPRRQ